MAIPRKSTHNHFVFQKMNFQSIIKFASAVKTCYLHVPQLITAFLSTILDLFISKLVLTDFHRLHLVLGLFLNDFVHPLILFLSQKMSNSLLGKDEKYFSTIPCVYYAAFGSQGLEAKAPKQKIIKEMTLVDSIVEY